MTHDDTQTLVARAVACRCKKSANHRRERSDLLHSFVAEPRPSAAHAQLVTQVTSGRAQSACSRRSSIDADDELIDGDDVSPH